MLIRDSIGGTFLYGSLKHFILHHGSGSDTVMVYSRVLVMPSSITLLVDDRLSNWIPWALL